MYTKTVRRIALSVFLLILFGFALAGCAPEATLTVKTLPAKTEYVAGEDLDLSGGVLFLVYGGKSREIEMDVDNVTHSGYDRNAVGKQTVTVVYSVSGRALSCAFSVTVFAPKREITGLRIVPPDRTRYFEGEAIDRTGLLVFAQYGDGSESAIEAGYALSVTGALTVEKSGAVEVRYAGFCAIFYISVASREIVSLEFLTNPAKTRYFAGDSPDLTGAELVYRFSDNSLKSVAMDTDNMTITPKVFRFYGDGQSEITVSDGKYTVKFPVTVEKRKSRIDAADAFCAASARIARTPESTEVYRAAYLSIDLVAPTETVALNGVTYGIGAPDADDAARAIGTAQSIRVANVSGVCPAIREDFENQRIDVHFYALAACGKRAVRLVTDDEVIEITLSRSEVEGYVTDLDALSFAARPHMPYAAHFIDADDRGVFVAVALSFGAEGGTQYAKCPANFSRDTVVWRDTVLASPVSRKIAEAVFANPLSKKAAKRLKQSETLVTIPASKKESEALLASPG